MKFIVIPIALTVWVLLSACASQGPPPEPMSGAQIANPASVNCVDSGYELEIREDAQGNQYGVCMFPDGTECEEWAFFRGDCVVGEYEVWPSTG